ncbi:unnamed protein product [Merluccius merluccius]
MWTVHELRAMLAHPVTGSDEDMLGYITETISRYEEGGFPGPGGGNSRQRRLLDAAWRPQVRLNRAEVLRHPARREEVSGLTREAPATRLVRVKEEQEEVWVSREEEGPQGPEEAGATRCPSSPVPVKREDHGEPAWSPLCGQTKAESPACDSEPLIKPEPQLLSCVSDQCMTAEPHVKEDPGEENCAGAEEPVADSGPAGDSKMEIGRAKFIEKIFPCSVCELECASKASLRTHMRVHTGERPYTCSDCGKAYTTKSCLNRHHQSIHSGDRPFRCKYCSFSFTFKFGLVRHLRVHTGERPYVCSFCGLKFTQSGNLTTHINVHHRITSHKCKMKA